MTTEASTLKDDAQQPGYLLGYELRPDRMTERVIISDSPNHVGFHRDSCTYWNRPLTGPTYNPVLVELAWEAEVERNRAGGPRTAFFCPRCMSQKIK